MSIQINAAFDSGNIRLVAIEGDRIDLEIAADHLSDFYQWFHFRVSGAKGRTLTFRILNAGGAAYAFGWPGYKARWSSDREAWRTTETSYADGVLSFTKAIDTDLLWFAYFAPYSMERHHNLVSRIALRPGVQHRQLGETLDGQPIDVLTLGTGPKNVWLYARQHPGESMAEWWAEGALEMLSDPDNAIARTLRDKATFHIVPNMNPDGSRRGHLRTNAAGVNLNREWHAPSLEKSPEVYLVRAAMDETGVDFAMDVHGDEAIPANFLAGYEGVASWTDAFGEKFYEFARRLAATTPDFQLDLGYEKAAPGKANLSMSTNQLAERFGAVSMTLEMPFKDHEANADAEFAWSPARCKALAVSCMETLAGFIDEI
jgi:murein tripeptide amidase MpaA